MHHKPVTNAQKSMLQQIYSWGGRNGYTFHNPTLREGMIISALKKKGLINVEAFGRWGFMGEGEWEVTAIRAWLTPKGARYVRLLRAEVNS